MKFSQLSKELQDHILVYAPDKSKLESLDSIQLWAMASVGLMNHTFLHRAHVEIFTPDPDLVLQRKSLADALSALLTDRQYIVVDQNPWVGRKLSIEVLRAGHVKATAEAEYINIEDTHGLWCNLIPYRLDLYRGELIFVVQCMDERDHGDRFLRTFKFIWNSSDTNWGIIDDLFYKAYGRIK